MTCNVGVKRWGAFSISLFSRVSHSAVTLVTSFRVTEKVYACLFTQNRSLWWRICVLLCFSLNENQKERLRRRVQSISTVSSLHNLWRGRRKNSCNSRSLKHEEDKNESADNRTGRQLCFNLLLFLWHLYPLSPKTRLDVRDMKIEITKTEMTGELSPFYLLQYCIDFWSWPLPSRVRCNLRNKPCLDIQSLQILSMSFLSSWNFTCNVYVTLCIVLMFFLLVFLSRFMSFVS